LGTDSDAGLVALGLDAESSFVRCNRIVGDDLVIDVEITEPERRQVRPETTGPSGKRARAGSFALPADILERVGEEIWGAHFEGQCGPIQSMAPGPARGVA
jgi:hypothetical protein